MCSNRFITRQASPGLRPSVAALAFAALVWPAAVPAQTRLGEGSGTAAVQTATARHGMVASQEREATRVGVDILERGGNAVDAAVAVGFALAVTLPRDGNLGGGRFMRVHLAESNENIAIDYRESAPAATTPDIFLDPRGDP